MNTSKKVAFLGLCTAAALILAYIEMLVPPLFAAVPGIKMGLPNLVILFLLYRYGFWNAAAVSLVRMVLVSLLFGNVMAFMYSVAGGVLSLLGMLLLKKCHLFSTVGVSVAGGVLHNVGQILAAMLLLDTAEIGYYLVVLAVSGTVAGVLIGCGSAALIKSVPALK